MGETQRLLELAGERFEMPEPAMDRLLLRRERRERTERIAAAVVGLGLAAVGIAGTVVTLRITARTVPGSEGQGAEAAGGTGFVLPTLAIWTTIAVLGLTVLAAVRLRGRVTHVDVEQEGRGPGEAAASARGQAAAPGVAPRKGGTEMDSKPTAGVGVPQAEMPSIRFDDGKLRRTNRWLIGAVIVLLVAVVGLGVALIAASNEETPAPPALEGLASADVVQVVDGIVGAMNAHDEQAFGALYAADAVVDDGATIYEGRDEIVGFYLSPEKTWNLERTSEVVQGPGAGSTFASHTFSVPSGSGILVYELDGNLQILRQWIRY
jgi:hypothetical protein